MYGFREPSFRESIAKAFTGVVSKLIQNISDTPIYIWVYIGTLVYVTRSLCYRQGLSTRKIVVRDRVINVSAAEESLVEGIVDTEKITESFVDVGGLEEVKQILKEHVIWPFTQPHLFVGPTVRSHPKGILLYGKPGTGKTMLARALAKELNCVFLNVKIETLFSKWVGETEKNAAAIFTLAEKLQPCVIFVDEIDSLLGSRSLADATPHTHAKTIFMTSWDGLEKNKDAQIIVVAATNRKLVIDEAIQRRLPLQVEVPPPDRDAREKILKIVLDHDLKENPRKSSIVKDIASKTSGYTGSDLTELCKAAALIPLRELHSTHNTLHGEIPSLEIRHFDEAMKRIRPSVTGTFQYPSPD